MTHINRHAQQAGQPHNDRDPDPFTTWNQDFRPFVDLSPALGVNGFGGVFNASSSGLFIRFTASGRRASSTDSLLGFFDMTETSAKKCEIEAAIGRCIWRWHNIETVLANMFRHLMGYPHHGPDTFLPCHIFFTPTNFRTQLSMFSVALNHRTENKSLLNEWKEVRKLLMKLKK